MSTPAERDTLHEVLSKLEQAQRLQQSPVPTPDTPVQVELLLGEAIAAIRKALGITKWPQPTVEQPDLETLEEWMLDEGICETTDGCFCEPDGVCPHGHPSWLLVLGLI